MNLAHGVIFTGFRRKFDGVDYQAYEVVVRDFLRTFPFTLWTFCHYIRDVKAVAEQVARRLSSAPALRLQSAVHSVLGIFSHLEEDGVC